MLKGLDSIQTEDAVILGGADVCLKMETCVAFRQAVIDP